MDIKRNRRDAVLTGKWTDRDLPMPEGMYPADGKKGHGNAASDNNVGWDMRAQSWQRGADTNYESIDAEKREGDTRFGTPYADVLPAPSDPGGPTNCGARYQTASYDGDASLPNPHNFSSNPGFMSVSTGDMATSGGPANGGTARVATRGSGRSLLQGFGRETSGGSSGRPSVLGGNTVGRSAKASRGNVALPAPGDTNPGSEGSPLQVTSGYGG